MNILTQLKDLKALASRTKVFWDLLAEACEEMFSKQSAQLNEHDTQIQDLDEKKANKSDIPSDLSSLEARVKALELAGTEVTKNAFSITFEDLDAVDSSQIGVWNRSLKRIEF